MAATIKCKVCGKLFRVKGKRAETARFCSNACRGKWQSTQQDTDSPNWKGGPVTLICECCGNTYQRGTTQVARSHFCSRDCCDKGKTLRSRVELICEQCGQSFKCPLWHAEGRRFCPTCYQAWQENHKRITFVCEQCGQEFQRQLYQAGTARFCSRSCLAKSRVGNKAANWKGGKSLEPYPPTFNGKFKHQVRDRDGRCCMICRLPGICVHHIDYNKENTIMANCVTLCVACHGVTNAHREYWQGTLAQLMTAREVARTEMEDENWPV